jgi:uncharacterized protein YfaS (alpha-2-macroglobulin family)
MTIFVTTDKPIYMQGQTVRFRAIPITPDLKAFSDAIDIYMIDPRGAIMRRWLSRQSNLGINFSTFDYFIYFNIQQQLLIALYFVFNY